MKPMLVLDNVEVGYGDNLVIEGVSLSVQNGQMSALIGANGAGKTTLTKLMCRMLKPSAGTVELEGKDVWQAGARAFSQKVAYVRQTERVAWPFTVEQIVLMGRFVHRGWMSNYTSEDHRVVDNALAVTGLTDLRTRGFDTLSGGEAQRAVLARAIAQEPQLLILDEPVAHLDIRYQIEILNTIRVLSRNGLAVVICLHDLTLTALYADNVALLHKGKVMIGGRPIDVLNQSDIEIAYGTSVHVDTFPGTDKLRITPVPIWVGTHLEGALKK